MNGVEAVEAERKKKTPASNDMVNGGLDISMLISI
jgi:hypothetical protein